MGFIPLFGVPEGLRPGDGAATCIGVCGGIRGAADVGAPATGAIGAGAAEGTTGAFASAPFATGGWPCAGAATGFCPMLGNNDLKNGLSCSI